MEDAKGNRASKARTLTRRIGELKTLVTTDAPAEDVTEKLTVVKSTFEELGCIQDEVMGHLGDAGEDPLNADVITHNQWYFKYEKDVSDILSMARDYLNNKESRTSTQTGFQVDHSVKIQKLKIPVFESKPRGYLKWKETFLRYTRNICDDMKYDYLLENTKGESHDYVSNANSFPEAIQQLDKEYGNKHLIMTLLIDDVKMLPFVRKGDFKGFEKLSYEANKFRNRLLEMGRHAEAENTYILKEIESKLNFDDLHKWLESIDDVDNRNVEEMTKWLEKQTSIRRTALLSSSNRSIYPSNSYSQPMKKANAFGSVATFTTSPDSICEICHLESHPLPGCSQFQELPLNEKWDYVKRIRACFICLKSDHRRNDCESPKCDICRGPHHRLLHNPRRFPRDHSMYANNSVINGSQLITGDFNTVNGVTDCNKLSKNNRPSPRCILPIVNCVVKAGDVRVCATTLIDSGSELHIMNSKLCNKLGLEGVPVKANIVGVGGEILRKQVKKVEVEVIDCMGVQTAIECIVLDNTCGKAVLIKDDLVNRVATEVKIPVEIFNSPKCEVDLLLGMGTPYFHQQLYLNKASNGIAIMGTVFGPCIVGPIPNGSIGNYERCEYTSSQISIVDENDTLLRHVEAELAGIVKECDCQLKSDEEILFEKSMETAWTIDETGRYEVKLPWKMDRTLLSNNREQALSRQTQLERKLSKDETIKKLFDDQIQEMISSEILIKADPSDVKRYLPLLAVVDLERESSKVRVCLDSKSRYGGVSLNDAFLKGKHELGDIYQMILRFRSGGYALLGDVRKMFWQIRISNEDRMYHGVIYGGKTYVFTRICFGNKPSPPIAELSMIKIAQSGKETHPLAYQCLHHKRYMDDIMDASNNLDKLCQIRNEVTELIGKFGFEIKNWYSNNSEVGTVADKKKVLGLTWKISDDTLAPGLGSKNTFPVTNLTKRKMLSRISEFWDPFGICSGVLLSAKLLFQSVVRLKVSWDESIDKYDDLLKKWQMWLNEVDKCNGVIMSRSILPTATLISDDLKCKLIGFSDGSSVAYGCALYLKWMNRDETKIDVKFLCAKAKVGPISGNTVPRNELCGALTLSRLIWSTLKAFEKTEISEYLEPETNLKLCVDSTIVLNWVQAPAINYKPFVKNKVIEIQNLVPSCTWKYVPSKKNRAADLLSKGCKKEDLDVILEGPDLLKAPEREWPSPPIGTCNETDTEEVNVCTAKAISIVEPIIDPNKFSSWKKLVRVTCYVQRFIKYCKEKRRTSLIEGTQEDRTFHNPTVDEIKEAEDFWVRRAQMELPSVKSKFEKLMPFTDESGIQRVGGRLRESHIFDYSQKHPILLPTDNPISVMILRDIHEQLFHPGHNRVIAESRKSYWIINARRLAKNIGFRCVTCRRWRGQALTQLMADLPNFRMKPGGAPFENSSVDYFGPFLVKYGKRQRIKAYGVVFTCLVTRAIHLDIALNMTTDSFLMAFRRFISTYGQPVFIRSDNGSNFRGAARELKEMMKEWQFNEAERNKLNDFAASYNLKWTFSTPLASHHNGAVESMVRSVKLSLNKIVKERILTEEEYRTLLAEVQCSVNSRPLWPPNDDTQECPITCNDLLRPKGLIRENDVLNVSDPRTRYGYIQKLVNEWWKIWMQNFVPNLQVRSKWFKQRENLQTGDLVLCIDPNISRSKWQMGKITETFKGSDGRVRSVEVKTSTSSYSRPITKLCLLLAKNEYEN